MNDTLALVEYIDPDWRDHFFDVDLATEFYRQYAADQWAEAEEEMS